MGGKETPLLLNSDTEIFYALWLRKLGTLSNVEHIFKP
jgi:hypothetical protein